MWGNPRPCTEWILIRLVSPNDKFTICTQFVNDNKTVLCHLCMNSAALEMKPPTDTDHVHWDFGRTKEQTQSTHDNSEELFIWWYQQKCVTPLQLLTTLLFSCPKPTFHSSSWQLVRCVRRPTRTWITFRRLAATCEFVESHLLTAE